MSARLVFGRGTHTKGRFKGYENRKATRNYILWRNMLQRCYSVGRAKELPTYAGCEVSDMFSDFQLFSQWAVAQAGYNEVGWQLDKDLLVCGNKMYAEYVCVFLPQEVNVFLTHTKCTKGDLPPGVYFDERHGKFQALISVEGRLMYLGTHVTLESADAAYRTAKTARARALASKYADRMDSRATAVLSKIDFLTNETNVKE